MKRKLLAIGRLVHVGLDQGGDRGRPHRVPGVGRPGGEGDRNRVSMGVYEYMSSRETEVNESGAAPGTGDGAMAYREIERQYALEVFPKRDITIVKGRGAEVWDDQGRRYIDCVAGIGVASVGHANPAVADALAEQARTLVTCPGIFYNDVRARLLEKLAADRTGRASRVASSATPAPRPSKPRSSSRGSPRDGPGSFQPCAASTAAPSARCPPPTRRSTGNSSSPSCRGSRSFPFNNAARLREAVGEDTAAVVIEPVQGEGGIRPASAEYLRAAREICDETGAMLVFDEIQTGFCRTGRMFACERSMG